MYNYNNTSKQWLNSTLVNTKIAVLTFWHQWADNTSIHYNPNVIGAEDTPYGSEFKLIYNESQGEYPCRFGYEKDIKFIEAREAN